MAPIGAAGGVVPVVVDLALGERPEALQLAGIPLVIIGAVLVASGQGGTSGLRTLTTVRPVGLWLAAIWALFYGTGVFS